jgi:hypothetical protein
MLTIGGLGISKGKGIWSQSVVRGFFGGSFMEIRRLAAERWSLPLPPTLYPHHFST